MKWLTGRACPRIFDDERSEFQVLLEIDQLILFAIVELCALRDIENELLQKHSQELLEKKKLSLGVYLDKLVAYLLNMQQNRA